MAQVTQSIRTSRWKCRRKNVCDNTQYQIGKLSPKAGYTFILLDSNIYIRSTDRRLRMMTTLAGKMSRYSASLAMPNIVLSEVSRISKTSKDKIIDQIHHVFNKVIILEGNEQIKAEAKKLETHFFECHYPDSIILATAKLMDAVLVTFDHKLLRTAQLEGIQAYDVKGFLKNWSVMI